MAEILANERANVEVGKPKRTAMRGALVMGNANSTYAAENRVLETFRKAEECARTGKQATSWKWPTEAREVAHTFPFPAVTRGVAEEAGKEGATPRARARSVRITVRPQ